jgi:hypothetical protein
MVLWSILNSNNTSDYLNLKHKFIWKLIFSIEIGHSNNDSKIDEITSQAEYRNYLEPCDGCERALRKDLKIPKPTLQTKFEHLNSKFIENPDSDSFDPTKKVDFRESSDSPLQSRFFGRYSKEGFARRSDVVNKTIIRSLKKFYSEKLCPTSKKYFDLDNEEVDQTFVNIDRVSFRVYSTVLRR